MLTFSHSPSKQAENRGAWTEIAKNLPQRSVMSIYRHGIRIIHPFNRGPWTPEECNVLIELVALTGKKWTRIQNQLNRSADSCRDKFREIDQEYERGAWNTEDTNKFVNLIREYLKVDANMDMKEVGEMVHHKNINIPWDVISKKMGNRSRLSCLKKWQHITGLLAPSQAIKTKRKVNELNPETSGNETRQKKERRARVRQPPKDTIEQVKESGNTANEKASNRKANEVDQPIDRQKVSEAESDSDDTAELILKSRQTTQDSRAKNGTVGIPTKASEQGAVQNENKKKDKPNNFALPPVNDIHKAAKKALKKIDAQHSLSVKKLIKKIRKKLGLPKALNHELQPVVIKYIRELSEVQIQGETISRLP